MQRGDRLLDDQRRQLLRVAVRTRCRHHQGGAVHQRPEKLPHRHVKTERGFLQHPIGRAQPIGLLHPRQTVVQRAMTVARTFRTARGTRGVNHVCQVLRAGQVRHILVGILGQPVGAGLQAEHGQAFRQRQVSLHMGLGQQQADTAVFKQVGQTLGRVFGVQRHISATGLENRQQPDDQFQRAFARHAHANFRADTLFAQAAGQTVGPLIQLGITQALPGKHQRAGLGRCRRLRLDVQVHAFRARIGMCGGIELVKRGLNLGGRQHRQCANCAVRVGHNGRQQVAPMRRHLLDARGVKQVGGVGQAGHQALAFLMGVQLQVKLGGAPLPLHTVDLQTGQHCTQRAGTALLVIEHDLEQRAVTQAALALQRLYQPLEGQVLIALRVQRTVAGLFQQAGKRQVPVKLGAQHLRVHEKADQATALSPIAVGHRDADTQILLTAVAVQQGLKTGQQQHERGHAALSGQRHQVFGQYRLKGEVQPRTLLRGLRRARAITRQFQHRLLVTQLPAPPVQLALQLTGFHPAPLPPCVVGVLNGQLGQRQGFTVHMGRIQLREFVDQHPHRPTIGHDVVQGQHQHVVVGVQLQQADPQQRAALQVERLGDVVFKQSQCTRHALGRGQITQVMARQLHACRRGRATALNLAIVLDKNTAQTVMAPEQRVEAVLQGVDIQTAPQAQGRRDVVRGAFRV